MDYQHDCLGQQSVFVCVLLSRMRNLFLGGLVMQPLSLSYSCTNWAAAPSTYIFICCEVNYAAIENLLSVLL